MEPAGSHRSILDVPSWPEYPGASLAALELRVRQWYGLRKTCYVALDIHGPSTYRGIHTRVRRVVGWNIIDNCYRSNYTPTHASYLLAADGPVHASAVIILQLVIDLSGNVRRIAFLADIIVSPKGLSLGSQLLNAAENIALEFRTEMIFGEFHPEKDMDKSLSRFYHKHNFQRSGDYIYKYYEHVPPALSPLVTFD